VDNAARLSTLAVLGNLLGASATLSVWLAPANVIDLD
jgi:hypothetical protein